MPQNEAAQDETTQDETAPLEVHLEVHHDVFLSYSTANKLIADAACAVLEARGIRCWIAPRDIMPSQDWSDAIIDAIADCRVFVLILSAASNLSEQVKREVQNAVSEGKFILPVRIEEVSLSKHMRYFIGTPHWLDALTPPMEHHLQRMANTIQGLLNSIQTKPGAESPADLEMSASPPQQPGFSWDLKRLAAIAAELSRFVGPISERLVREASVSAEGYQALCQQLAANVLPERERSAFLNQCLPYLPDTPAAPPVPLASSAISAVPMSPESSGGLVLGPEVMAAAAKELANYVGPMAKILVKQAAKAASDQNDFHRLLSEQVPSSQEKADLLRRLKR